MMENPIQKIQIVKIHIAIKDLNIIDKEYRDILSGFNNSDGNPCTTCKELTEKQANILLDLFKKKLGWQEKKKGKKLKYEEYGSRDSKFASPAQMRKIEAVWMNYSREKTVTSMNNFIFRILKVSLITSVHKKDVNKLLKAIQSLKPDEAKEDRPVRRSPEDVDG